MEVILKEDIPNLGKIGDVVRVRDGYARNYLLPRGVVLLANKKNLKVFEHQKRVVAAQKERVVKQAQSLAERLAQVALVIPMKSGEEGRLFGSERKRLYRGAAQDSSRRADQNPGRV